MGEELSKIARKGSLVTFKVRLSRVARVPIALNCALGVLGLVLVKVEVLYHMALMGIGAVASFALAVYMVSVEGFRGSDEWTGWSAVTVVVLALALCLTPLAYLLGLRLGYYMLTGSTVLFTVFALLSTSKASRLLRFLVLYPVLALLAVLLYYGTSSIDIVKMYMLLAYSLATPMITTVTLYGLAQNYGASASIGRVLLVYPANLAGLALALQGHPTGYRLLALSVLAHFPAIGYYRFNAFLKSARKTGSSVFYRSARFIVFGHGVALVGSLLTIYYTALYLKGEASLIPALHSLYMLFIGGHIYFNAVIKLPIIMGIRPTRRFSLLSLTLLLASGLLRNYLPDISLMLVLVSLAFLLREFEIRDVLKRAPKGRLEASTSHSTP